MDSDRKYRQPGYMDTDRDSRGFGADRPKPHGPRPPQRHRPPPAASRPACRRGPVLQLRDNPSARRRLPRQLPQVQRRAALLQAVFPLRAIHAFPVPQAHPGAHRHEGQSQRVQFVYAAGDRGPGRHRQRAGGGAYRCGLSRAAQSRRRPQRLRQALQGTVGGACLSLPWAGLPSPLSMIGLP